MSAPTQADRIAFWMHSYARASFLDARSYAKTLLDEDPPTHSSIRRAFTAAIIGAYCRPFKQRPRVKLPDDFVSPVHRGTHDAMITLRDKVVAHRDLDGPITEWGFVSQLQLNFRASQFTVDTLSPVITNEDAQNVIALTGILVAKLDALVDRFMIEHIRVPPADSSYVVSLDESPAQWLIPNPNGGPMHSNDNRVNERNSQ